MKFLSRYFGKPTISSWPFWFVVWLLVLIVFGPILFALWVVTLGAFRLGTACHDWINFCSDKANS